MLLLWTALWITTGRLAAAAPSTPPTYGHAYHTPGQGYEYSWAVQDDASYNEYRHQESSVDDVVNGFYQVLLPDGRLQTVKYTVEGDSGFVADVTYELRRPFGAYPTPPSGAFKGRDRYVQYGGYVESTTAPPETYPQFYYGPSESSEDYAAYYPVLNYYVPYDPSSTEAPATEAPWFDDITAAQLSAARVSATGSEEASEEASAESSTEVSAQVSAEIPAEVDGDYGMPLYRIDFYSARAKSGLGLTTPEPYGAAEELDAGVVYIKPASDLAVPDQLGTYDVDHRKAAARHPSNSDYQAPASILHI